MEDVLVEVLDQLPMVHDAANWQYTVGAALMIPDYPLAEAIVKTAVALKIDDRTLSMMRRMIVRSRGKQ